MKEEFEILISQYGDQASVEFIQVTSELFDSMPVVEYLSTVAFYRLLIPDMLPAKECRAIYLDPDLIVETDIGKLWDCSSKEKATTDGHRYTRMIRHPLTWASHSGRET